MEEWLFWIEPNFTPNSFNCQPVLVGMNSSRKTLIHLFNLKRSETVHMWQIQMLFAHSDHKQAVLGKAEALPTCTCFVPDDFLQICTALEHKNYTAEHGHILSGRGTKMN